MPIYQTADDKFREWAIGNRIARHFNLIYHDFDRVEFDRDGTPIVVYHAPIDAGFYRRRFGAIELAFMAEIKERFITRDKYPTIFIDKAKLIWAEKYALAGIPVAFIPLWDCGAVGSFRLTRHERDGFRGIRIGGRDDRGDRNDKEDCAYYDIGAGKILFQYSPEERAVDADKLDPRKG